jgi:hypothetical protein
MLSAILLFCFCRHSLAQSCGRGQWGTKEADVEGAAKTVSWASDKTATSKQRRMYRMRGWWCQGLEAGLYRSSRLGGALHAGRQPVVAVRVSHLLRVCVLYLAHRLLGRHDVSWCVGAGGLGNGIVMAPVMVWQQRGRRVVCCFRASDGAVVTTFTAQHTCHCGTHAWLLF